MAKLIREIIGEEVKMAEVKDKKWKRVVGESDIWNCYNLIDGKLDPTERHLTLSESQVEEHKLGLEQQLAALPLDDEDLINYAKDRLPELLKLKKLLESQIAEQAEYLTHMN